MFDVKFKGVSCELAGVLVKKRPSIPAPVIEQEEFIVPGRDGVLLSKVKRYPPIEIPVEFNFMSTDPDRWGHSYRRFKQWLRGAGDLKFSDDDDVFYKCYRASITTTERSSYRIGSADVTFYCDPYTYFSSGEFYQAPSKCKYNPYDVALPVYHVTGSGEFVLIVNGQGFRGAGECYIDTEKQETTDASGNLINSQMMGNYSDLALREGENEIEISSGFVLRIKPRWRSV